ncbi:hypothetical protein [Xylophilus sp. GOD-11R]|uniref:hypothetical protein n=1 Tax=Xylophilus sp. GOD-11R TaxID=3089814 RepID=UPI00298CCD32|nr:hypothetical protein [Xylophilus sp. GOD-11R]WPB56329.1 hypothetical protein R9X41_19630 [Xylophilus sp. GOD-11R]
MVRFYARGYIQKHEFRRSLDMSIVPFPQPLAARKRTSQRQQQPARFWLNRQQQQQGYSEYQRGQAAPARASIPDSIDLSKGQNEES